MEIWGDFAKKRFEKKSCELKQGVLREIRGFM